MLANMVELLDFCTDFINEIDDFEDVQLDTDFQCYPETNEIFISILASQNSVEEFMETLLERTYITGISEFTWSLLHEVGHCETWRFLGKRTHSHCRNQKKKIRKGKMPTITYYALTDEKIATNWAIRFVENNFEMVKAFDEKAIELLKKVFIENRIDLES